MAYAAQSDPKEGLVEYTQFLGLRNNVDAELLGREDLSIALNVDLNDALRVGRRKGHSAVVTANIDRDVWALGPYCLGVGSNALKRVNTDWSTTTLRTGLTPARPLAYTAVADRLFWSNGAEFGCVQNGANRTWGVTLPGIAVATAASGAMRAGKYQYAYTYLRSDGQESGAPRAGTIELTDTGGISLASIFASADPTVTHKAIYCTSVGGETLFRVGVIANAVTTFSIIEASAGSSPLITQFLSPPPAGDFIAEWHGWMLVAKDDRLYVSEPYAPELFDLRKSYPFTDAITMVAPARDGVWVGTLGQVVWLAGDSPEEWKPVPKADYGAVPGTLSFAAADLIGDKSEGDDSVAAFATTRGLCLGMPNGTLANLTQPRFAYPIQERGAGIVRRHNGMAQFVCSMRGAETAGNAVT